MFTDVSQEAAGTGCSYAGGGSLATVSQDNFLVQDHAGVLKFDLTGNPVSYEGQFLTRDLVRQITFTCPDSTTETSYGDTLWWVDTTRSEDRILKTDTNGGAVVFDGFVGGDDGYTEAMWIIFRCEADLGDSYVDALDGSIATIIDQTIADAVLEGL